MVVSKELQDGIKESLNIHSIPTEEIAYRPIGGGCINQCFRISFSDKEIFCKINSANKFPQLFIKEKKALERIEATGAIKTPNVIDCFETSSQQVLLQEWIYQGDRTETFWKEFGKQLAALHKCSNTKYGWEEDNYMGSIPQTNTYNSSWVDFFTFERLQPLVKKSVDKGMLSTNGVILFEQLYTKLPEIFDLLEPPSFLHGDLWSGNFMCNSDSQAVLIDPACYYGHRSMDLAMTTLFGGFPSTFYEAYNYHYPVPSNHQEQWSICNLYPLLIHLLLFGRSYLTQIENTLQQFA